MGLAFAFAGSSGKVYPYSLTDPKIAAPLPMQGGIYIRAIGTVANPQPVLISAAISLRRTVMEELHLGETAERVRGAKLFYFHPVADAKEHEKERTDLLMAYKPVMNVTG